MKQPWILLILAATALMPAPSKKEGNQSLAGRWDLTITTPKDTYPSWMEFTENSGAPAVRVVGREASVHAVRDLKVEGSHLSFTTSEWFGDEIKVTWEMNVAGGK